MLKLIPVERQAAVLAALQTTFNTAQLGAIDLLHGGGSTSLTFKITINQQPYVLRVMGLDQSLADRATQIDSLKKAAALNIAPHCYYADTENGIMIMAYISTQLINARHIFLKELAITVKNLHQNSNLLPVFINLFDYLNGLSKDLLQHSLPDFIKQFLIKIIEVQQLLIPRLTQASCHNDLNISNVLFDGNKIWLIDWEAAGVDDPFFDLATVCNQFTFNPAMADIFINTYFGQQPDAYQRAKLLLMQIIVHHYQAAHFLLHTINAGKIITDLPTPDLYAWNLGYTNGVFKLTTPDDFLLYGLAQIKAGIATMQTEDFSKAKLIISE